MFINDFSPILGSFGPVHLRWYGLMFAIGIFLNYAFLSWVWKREKFDVRHLDSLLVYLFLGMLIGARLGEVFFYQAGYFLANPLEIFMIWKGGLASHGAVIGLFAAYFLWIWRWKEKFFKYADILAVGMPLTGAFVRIGNYFNSEIVGTAYEGFPAVVFKSLGEDFGRHPVQLYEAVMNFLVFGIMFFVYKCFGKRLPNGVLLFGVLGLYFVGRFVAEFFKARQVVPESIFLSMGQILSVIPILVVLGFFFRLVFAQYKHAKDK